ncbi:MAG: PKD domain-containing protein, partial [Sphingobacteriales bacterium]
MLRNCKDTIIKLAYIKVNGPTVNFSGAPTSGCIPLTVNFTDQTVSPDGFAIRAWRFMPASPWTIVTGANTSFTYTSAGNYTVRLAVTDNNGCTDTMVKPAYINITKPVADFTTGDTVICKGATAQFANTSVGSNLTYLWSFGDGSTATATNPAHVYSNPGVYTVRLIATNSSGCKDTVTKTSYVKVNGVLPGFTVSDTIATCPPITVNFTDTSVGATNTWWSFGNGNISTFQNPTTVYTQSGTYTVTQYGQSGGCVDSALQTITVLGPSGTLSYSPVSGCLPLTVNFTSTNTNTQVLIWDMNNGVTQTTTGSTTTYTYTQPGAYVPVLLLSDGVSCIVPVVGSDTIRVGNIVADFSILNNNLCQAGTVNFADTILTPGVVAGSRIWTFGDGGTSTAHNPSHTYTAPGTYTVTLIIGSSAGCTDTLVKTVTILTPPSVNAGNAQSICAGLTTGVQLQASGAATYIWSPANTLSCTSCSNPVASPVSTTTYTVVGTSANGCQDTSQVTVTVNPIPAITTGPPVTICEGSSVQLAAAGAVSYSWSPAGTLSCTGCSNPTATPLTTTTYTITGTSAAGCTSTAQILVNVTPNPVISAIADQPQVCAGTTVQLQASGALTYSWIPATGLSCSTCPNPTVSPLSSTTYIVSGINAQGCTDTASVTVTVNSSPAVSAGPNQAI